MDQTGKVLSEEAIRRLNKDHLSRLSKIPSPDVDSLSGILQDVLRTTEEVRLENTHRAAACDALCGLLKNGCSSKDAALRELCTSPQVWKRALCMYFDRHNDARARPMKQILEILIRVLQEMPSKDPTKSQACIQYAVEKCFGSMVDQADTGAARPAMFILDNLLSKKLVQSSYLVSMTAGMASDSGNNISGLKPFSAAEQFVYFVLRWARNPDVAPICGKLLASFCSGLSATNKDTEPTVGEISPTNAWQKPLWHLLDEYPSLIGVLESDVLPGLLRLDETATMALLHDLPFNALLENKTAAIGESGIRLCLMILRISDEVQFAQIDDIFEAADQNPPNSIDVSKPTVPERICSNLLCHSNPDVRLSALAILTSPKHGARPLSRAALVQLQEHMWDFFEEADARVRNDYLSLIKRLFSKLEAIATRLSKLDSGATNQGGRHASKALPGDQIEDYRALLAANVSFLRAFQERISAELVPTASYQRHILALKSLTYLHQLKLPEAVAELIVNEQSARWLVRPLLDLVMDPFEDVRANAASLLLSYSCDLHILHLALQNAERIMRASGRADHADGYGRLVELYSLLQASVGGKNATDGCNGISENTEVYLQSTIKLIDEVDGLIDVARKSLERAVADAPLHGKVIALKHLIATKDADILLLQPKSSGSQVDTKLENEAAPCAVGGREQLAIRVLNICEAVWDVVYPVLCIDSPEGTNFVTDEEDDTPDIGIKDTLSYAWRALKESSLLLRSVMAFACKGSSINTITMTRMGQLLFSQLAQLRHRGAFSAVAQTYAAFCSHCIIAKTTDAQDIAHKLYGDTLACIQEKSTALTRRSAGLPALTVGLLSAEPGGELTSRALDDLQAIAQRPVGAGVTSELPQVHALNCLKDIFTSTKLGPATEMFLSDVLLIAVDCLDKDLWAIRNSGLMLLKALLLRLEEGRVKSNNIYKQLGRGQFSKAAYAKHPALAQVVLDLLRKATDTNDVDGSLPQQDRLIEKIFPAMEVIERVGIPPAIADEVKSLLLQHLSSSVWAMRDKTAACLSLLLGEHEILRFSRPEPACSSNHMHGLLLLIEHALQEQRVKHQMPALARTHLDAWEMYSTHTSSPTVHELYHEIMGVMLEDKNCAPLTPKYLELCGLGSKSCLTIESFLGTDLKGTVYSEDFASMAVTVAAGLHHQQTELSALDVVKQFLPTSTRACTGSLLTLGALPRELSATSWIGHMPQVALDNLELLSDAALVSLLKYLPYLDLYSASNLEEAEHWNAAHTTLLLCRAVLRRRSNALVLNALIELWGAVSATVICIPYPNDNDRGPRDHRTHNWSTFSRSCLAEWYALLKTAMGEQTDVEIREAAIDSFLKFKIVCAAVSTQEVALWKDSPLVFIIYSGLIDDDEEIRLKSAQCASWLLTGIESRKIARGIMLAKEPGSDLSPAAARQRLISFFRNERGSHSGLDTEPLTRIMGIHPQQLLHATFESRYQQIEEKSTTLFDEEKQNLFVDEYSEALQWTQLARSRWGLPQAFCTALVHWVQRGLDFILTKTRSNTSPTKREMLYGPLGDFSRPEIFLLVARLFLMAELILSTRSSIEDGDGSVLAIATGINYLAEDVGDSQRLLTGLTEELHQLIMQAFKAGQTPKHASQSHDSRSSFSFGR